MSDHPSNHRIAELEDRLRQLEERNALLEKVIDLYPYGVVVTDRDLNLVLCNRSQRKLLDYPDSLFQDRYPTLRELFHFNAARGEYGPGDINTIVSAKIELVRQREAHCFERQRPNGRHIKIQGLPLEGGGFVTSYMDVTHEHEQEKAIANLALTDDSTGLMTTRALLDRLSLECARSRRGESFALHLLNIENFDAMEKDHGRAALESLVGELAGRLKAIVHDVDAIGRISDNSFVIIQSMLQSPGSMSALSLRLSRRAQQPFTNAAAKLTPEFSIGSIVVKKATDTPHALIERADAKALASRKQEFSL